MKTCQWDEPDESCSNLCEGNTNYCSSHNRLLRKIESDQQKAAQKRKALLSKPKKINKPISKNPKDWSNTFLCSDGTRVTQSEIDRNRRRAYEEKYPDFVSYLCEGCKQLYARHHAHIIPQARCKHLGKTELIWHTGNFFPSCYDCNSSIENPKGNDWQQLKNISYCLSFIEKHDKELFAKFESRLAATEPHKI